MFAVDEDVNNCGFSVWDGVRKMERGCMCGSIWNLTVMTWWLSLTSGSHVVRDQQVGPSHSRYIYLLPQRCLKRPEACTNVKYVKEVKEKNTGFALNVKDREEKTRLVNGTSLRGTKKTKNLHLMSTHGLWFYCSFWKKKSVQAQLITSEYFRWLRRLVSFDRLSSLYLSTSHDLGPLRVISEN